MMTDNLSFLDDERYVRFSFDRICRSIEVNLMGSSTINAKPKCSPIASTIRRRKLYLILILLLGLSLLGVEFDAMKHFSR